MAERLLFVTGKLAAPALRDTLGRAELPFDYDVAVMKITVAALMTTDWIAKRLEVPDAVTRIMIPGLCEGDVEVIGERFGIPAEKGPNDLKALPRWFGQEDARASYGERDIRVFAEINHVPRLTATRSSRSPATTATPAPTSSTSGSRSAATGSTRGRT